MTITEPEYKSTILQGIPDSLAVYVAQTLSTLCLATKYTGKLIDMSDVINLICKEADHVKMRRVLKELTTSKGKKVGQTDEALVASSSSDCRNNNNNSTKHCKGKCHHCNKEGHTKKRKEAAAATSNQTGQTAQGILGSSKPENKPVGSMNAVFDDNSDSDGFCAAEEKVTTCDICTDPDLYLDNSDSDNDWDDIQAEIESTREQSDKLESIGDGPDELDNEGEEPNIKKTAAAIIAPTNVDGTPYTEVYNLRASRHISL